MNGIMVKNFPTV